jgi:cytochrome P450
MRIILLNSSELVHAAFVEQANQFRKAPPRADAVMRLSLGNGLLASDGTLHREQRKLMASAFQPRHLQVYADTMTTYTTEMLNMWQHDAAIDAEHELWQLTLRIIAQTLFDADVQHEAADLRQALTTVARASNALLSSPLQLYLPLAVSPAARQVRHAVERVDHTVHGMIADRRRHGDDRTDLLSVLLRAQDADTGLGMDDQQLRDEVMTLFLAGHETTAIALLWTLILLAQHPAVAKRLQEEVDGVLAGRVPTADDLHALPFTRQVIQEALRLYPPLYVLARWTERPVDLGTVVLPAHAMVVVSPYTLHRRTDYFPDPARFDPDRWTPQARVGRPSYAYVPFGAGPRQCIGNHFAMMELQLILATITQRVSLQLAPNQHVAPDPQITLRPPAGLKMIVEHRAR